MKTIKELIINYKNTDKNTSHSYIDCFYEEKFLGHRNKNLDILEIGVEQGDSIMLWSEVFPNSRIYGIDLNIPKILWETIENGPLKNRVFLLKENAYDLDVSCRLPDFDIVIDDGPHNLHSQFSCLELYFKKLKPNGLLIIEDIGSIENANRLILKYKELGGTHLPEIRDLRHVKGRFDDILLCVRK
jgi:hypothetical protein